MAQTDVKRSPLSGVRVLELSYAAAAVTGRHLAELGAEVIKIEPQGGEAARLTEPTEVLPSGERLSLFWLAFNVGKKSVCLDLSDSDGERRFAALAAEADIVVTDYQRLGAAETDRLHAVAKAANPAIVWTDIWPFGRGGRDENFPAGDLSIQALGGHLGLNGDRDRRPVRVGLPVAMLHGGSEAVSATLMAYYHRLNTGEGQRVDVSMQEAIVWTLLNSTMTWQLLGQNEERGGAVRKERANKFFTRLIWECADGHIFFSPVGGGMGVVRAKSYAALVRWMAEEGVTDELLTSKDWTGTDAFRISQEDYDSVSAIIGRFVRSKTMEELMDRAVADNILLAPISGIPGIHANKHLRARDFFERIEDRARGTSLDYPARWARFSATRLQAPAPAPQPGEHDRDYLDDAGALRAAV